MDDIVSTTWLEQQLGAADVAIVDCSVDASAIAAP